MHAEGIGTGEHLPFQQMANRLVAFVVIYWYSSTCLFLITPKGKSRFSVMVEEEEWSIEMKDKKSVLEIFDKRGAFHPLQKVNYNHV